MGAEGFHARGSEHRFHTSVSTPPFYCLLASSHTLLPQVSKKGLPLLPFGPFEKAFLFLFAEEAGTYVTTTTRSRNSETADELGTAAVFTCIVGHGQL